MKAQAEGARAECFPEFLRQDGVADDGNVTGDERSVCLARHAHLHRTPRIVFPATEYVRVERSSDHCISEANAGLRAAHLFHQLLPVRLVQQEVSRCVHEKCQ